jgi:hydrogenase expression/formation protein HypE
VILSGDVGRHGMAVMAVREGLEFDSQIESDCAPLGATVLGLLEAGVHIHCLRDLTRGGLASGLVEIAQASQLTINVVERDIPVNEDVRGACEILGLDPLYVANEGRFIAFVSAHEADKTLRLLGDQAKQIGIVSQTKSQDDRGVVTLTSAIGAARILDMLSGEQLPRIC